MSIDIIIPSLGESVAEGSIACWLKQHGDYVQADEVVLELETDKAAMEITAPVAGVLKIDIEAGETVEVGTCVGTVDSQAAAPTSIDVEGNSNVTSSDSNVLEDDTVQTDSSTSYSPAVRHLLQANGLNAESIVGTGPKGRLTKGDVLAYLESQKDTAPEGINLDLEETEKPLSAMTPSSFLTTPEDVQRVPMTKLRQRIAERLVEAQQQAAILTTFNEVDMSAVKELRSRYRDTFEQRYGVRLGFMSLFGRACIQALKEIREVNAQIDGTDLVYYNHVHLGIAVGTARGLVVPVIKNADTLSIAELELAINTLAEKARDGKITPDDLSGGTFTISNGGVYGSLLSTPILNPPQTGILGMHKIEERPVVVNGEIVIRPMMYLALSYDHRVIDGEQAVSFLVRIKMYLEEPARMLLNL
ncbi:dihydrolipoyllysine-residue succinyltransferase component of 2-oxoglutarate dehydrogenase complex-like [Ylistrum balloti]|uniref:dihydrolipoyllysine-residue succinyltransferase component of 2-oxoglutarate dehydrogenase complex-like n=1 Tax=Ylistrum balloti TaxID=509963 RepID=UPI002905B4EF|nr:dihydrolipoyllysine-residue succinyltransferase component of 2-oxoglutarate dehydrogenase complex-like [Ylistrum balloti]